MRFDFQSISNKDIGYRFDTEFWGVRRNMGDYVDENLRVYETYGDAGVQHAPERLVQRAEWCDCLGSLAKHLLENPEQIEKFCNSWPSTLDPKAIEFAAGVQFREDKDQWYSVNEQKVSKDPKKQHDRRWEKVPGWANGTVEAVNGLLATGYHDGALRIYYRFYQIKEWMYEHGVYAGGKTVTDHLEIPNSRQFGLADAALTVFEALLNLVQGFKATDRARWLSDRYASQATVDSKEIAS